MIIKYINFYKRGNQNEVRRWGIDQDYSSGGIRLIYGIVGLKNIEEFVRVVPKGNRTLEQQINLEVASRINKQRKSGYRQFHEIVKDGRTSDSCDTVHDLLFVLSSNLPTFNLDANNYTKVALCVDARKRNVPFDKKQYIGGAKLNGIRSKAMIIKNPNKSIFSTHDYEPFFTSRDGGVFYVNHIKELILNTYSQEMLKDFYELGVEIDGEFYIPGYTVNRINSAVKNQKNPDHKLIQYWIFDLAHPELIQSSRFSMLDETLDLIPKTSTIDEHLKNKDKLVTIERFHVCTNEELVYMRDLYIDRGFEGIVIRDLDSTYQYGKKNSSMFKFKSEKEGEFLIVDVVPEGEKRSYMAKFILQNDINDETFIASINCPIAESTKILANKNDYIGRMCNVVYRERSGVLSLPFHAKARLLRDENELN